MKKRKSPLLKRKNWKVANNGYTLIEMIIIFVIIISGLGAVAGNIPAGLASVEPENVMAQTATLILEIRENALRGLEDEEKSTFTIDKALALPHRGVNFSSNPPSYGLVNCSSSVCSKEQTICVSGQSFCFTPAKTFSFEKYSGKLSNAHGIFLTNEKRNLGLMMSESGDLTVIELINGQWHSRTDLQQLIPNNQKVKEPIKTSK